jgi:hypothetical protein
MAAISLGIALPSDYRRANSRLLESRRLWLYSQSISCIGLLCHYPNLRLDRHIGDGHLEQRRY